MHRGGLFFVFPRVFPLSEWLLRVIKVEAHAAHCRVAIFLVNSSVGATGYPLGCTASLSLYSFEATRSTRQGGGGAAMRVALFG